MQITNQVGVASYRISAKINQLAWFSGLSIAILATLKMEVTYVLSCIASHSVQSTLGMLLLGGLGACPQENFENLPS